MDLRDAAARDVLAPFGTMAEAELDVDEALDGMVTIKLKDVSWLTALDAVCESVGCQWTLVGGSPRRLEIRAVLAQEGEAEGLDARISLSLEKASAAEVLESFGEIAGLTVSLPKSLGGTVSFELQGVTARTALTAVCESLGCRWTAKDGTLIVALDDEPEKNGPGKEAQSLDEKLAQPLSLSLKDAPVGAVLKSYAKILGVPLDLSPEVTGLVTVELSDVPARDGLNQVCRLRGCRWQLKGAAGSEVLEVRPSS